MHKIPGIKKSHDEDILQEYFVRWLDKKGYLYTASCAGMNTTMSVGARMKRMGAKSGFPDIQICEQSLIYGGLFIELKSETGIPSKDQKEWRDALNTKGYLSVIMPKGLDFNTGLDWLKNTVKDYFIST